nr:hypothetical protein [Fodinicola feengrottensis]
MLAGAAEGVHDRPVRERFAQRLTPAHRRPVPAQLRLGQQLLQQAALADSGLTFQQHHRGWLAGDVDQGPQLSGPAHQDGRAGPYQNGRTGGLARLFPSHEHPRSRRRVVRTG